MLPRRLRLLLLPFAVAPLLLGALRCHPARQMGVVAGALAERGRVWEPFETAGSVWADFENPYDPEQIRVDAELVAPDGSTRVVPGFHTREFRRALVGGFEKRTPKGPPHWRVRMTPSAPGTWEWRWIATTPYGVATTDWFAFEVDPPAPGRHGFLRRSPLDGRYLRHDDGTPWIGIGENLSWYDGRGSFAYDDWLGKLAARGVNLVRLWMPSWAFGIEWTTLGDYGDRLDRAWQLDQVMDAAARHGIAVVLCIQNHGPFSLEANSEWSANPYNAANGGPLAHPEDVFTDPTARALFQRRLRYVVARWGHATNLLAWELWNEVDLVGGGPAVDAWHVEMADTLRALDPHDHLVTTSLSRSNLSSVWALPEIDLTQIHHYSFPLGIDLPSVVAGRMRAFGNAYPGKPRLLAEYGVDYRGPAETLALDPDAIGFHQGLWIGLLSGGFATGMSWWWDNLVDPEDLYFHFEPLAVLVDGIAFDEQGFETLRPPATAPGRNLAAYALRGDDALLAWLQNVDHQWLHPPLPGPDPTPVEDATLVLDGLADGTWTARWIDPYTGEDVAVDAVEVAGGGITLAVPTFAKDVALRMQR